MNKKNYNKFFNLHTVSGIVISVALYIIFFAGSISFFRDEIEYWEKGEEINKTQKVDIDAVLKNLDKEYHLLSRDVELIFRENRDYLSIYLEDVKDTIVNPNGKEVGYGYSYNIKSQFKKSYDQDYHIGNFIYKLHYLDILPLRIGRYLSGLVAVFFLFALVSGIVIHWKKMISNFYTFNPKAMLKKLWTDAHTALGFIGIPYQLIYAITGGYFGFNLLILIPALSLFNNDEELLFQEMIGGSVKEWKTVSNVEHLPINSFIEKTENYWDGFKVEGVHINNYGGTNMTCKVEGVLDSKNNFYTDGSVTYDAYSGKVMDEKSPHSLDYFDGFTTFWSRLHIGDFGGIAMKIAYFIFGLLTCFVIITGVLIWIEARNKKSMTLKERKFTAKVGHIYLAICLSMLPVTAVAFIFAKISNGKFENYESIIYWFYLILWLLFTVFYALIKDNYFTNKNSLLLGAIFGFLIPFVNGITSGNWFWKMYANKQYEIFMVDMLWVFIASTALLFYVKIKPSIKERSIFAINPIKK